MVLITPFVHEDPTNEKLIKSVQIKVLKDDSGSEVHSHTLQKFNEKIAFRIPESKDFTIQYCVLKNIFHNFC